MNRNVVYVGIDVDDVQYHGSDPTRSVRRTLKSTRQPARLRLPIADFPKPHSPRPAMAPFSVSDSLDSSEHASNKRRERNSGREPKPDVTVEQAR